MLYFSLVVIALLLSICFSPFVILFCKKQKILSNPERYKFYRDKKPMLGGIIIFVAFFLPALVTIYGTPLVMKDPIFTMNEINKITITFLISAIIVLLTSIWADVKYIKGKYHWLFIIIASIIIHTSEFKFKQISNPFGEPITLGKWGVLLTIFWIIIIINIIEILNFVEGLSTIIIIFVSSILLYGAIADKEIFVSALLSTFTGAMIGYLIYNIHPSKIISGKSGIRFIGFMTASIILFSRRKITTTTIFIFPSIIIIFFLVFIILSSLEKTLILKNKDVITKGQSVKDVEKIP